MYNILYDLNKFMKIYIIIWQKSIIVFGSVYLCQMQSLPKLQKALKQYHDVLYF